MNTFRALKTTGITAFAVASAFATLAATQAPAYATTGTTTTTLGPPAQGVGRHKLFMYVDTVAGGTYKPVSDCTMTNLFQPGETVVFRMDGVQVSTGGTDLTTANVLDAFVKVPGEKDITMVYGTHGTSSYWTGAWAIPATYPLGTVNFSVWVTTKAVPASTTTAALPEQTGIFSQDGLAPPSRLTIVKA